MIRYSFYMIILATKKRKRIGRQEWIKVDVRKIFQ